MSDIAQRQSRPPSIFDPANQPWIVNDDGFAPIDAAHLTPAALRQRFTQPPAWSPEVADESRRPFPGRESLVAAAVLIPLVTRADGLHVLLTQRTAHLHDHAGQIAFPGGRAQPSDTSLVDTALRETEEETGLTREYVDVLGSLPDYLTSTGFKVTPVIGLAEPNFTLAHDPFEVAEVFEVPLAFLMNPANHRLHTATLVDGVPRRYYSIPYENRFIWGATAGMLRNLYHLLRA
ncbi:CoA pyrophosphatase [Achromobacter sp. GG226]|uniref:CoA pyrophosphatase n=1 Tax=Verticiella alkaliphila TaxID=2779529 RepID=UPI001C0B2D95|nr:CoA pyrophosphatase [Verticiella sp. GG226]MBU4612697.1 CoA pyrophosphatase [Verticiella sp. GG226]